MGTEVGTTCTEEGNCSCKTGYTGSKCDECDAQYFSVKEGSSCEGE